MENRYIHYGLVLGLIAAISAGILGTVNNFTSVVIYENSMKIVNEARKEVLPEAVTFKPEETVQVEGQDFVPGYDADDKLVGYVASAKAAGYGGDIDFVLGIENSDAVITGLSIISHAETPGLGAKISNHDWQELWKGRDSSYEFNKSVDAFAGATISPKAVYTATIDTLKVFENEVKK